MKPNLAMALVHLFDAYERLDRCSERVRQMFWTAVAKLRALIAIAEARA